MELWIRSQSKQSLIKVENISLEIKKDNVIFITSDEWRLGTYISKKRALEVLDEIQNILKPQEYEIEKGNGYYTKSTNISTYVYEMPKE